jgi:integrase
MVTPEARLCLLGCGDVAAAAVVLPPGNRPRRSYWPLLESAGIPRARFHDHRYTAATLMLGKGPHPKIASEMLGHSKIGIRLDAYSHVTPTMQRQVIEALEGELGG